MRITVDLDTKNPLILVWILIKGTIICEKLPICVRKSPSRRGYHIIWSGLDITEDEMLHYRKMIGDDSKRIRLDASSKKRVKQILFTKKIVKYQKAKKSKGGEKDETKQSK